MARRAGPHHRPAPRRPGGPRRRARRGRIHLGRPRWLVRRRRGRRPFRRGGHRPATSPLALRAPRACLL